MDVRSVAVRLRAEMAQFKREWSEAGKTVRETAKDFDEAGQKAKQSSRHIDESGTAVGRLSATMRNHRQEWDETGDRMLKTGAVLVGVTALVTKAAMDWETAWAGVTKTVDGNAAQMGKLEGQLRGLAKTLPASHQEIAAVAEAAGQLGVQRESVAAFTRTMIDLSETTNLSADEAATSIAQLMNVMQSAPSDVDNLGASLVALGNDGASTERDIIQMAQNIAGAGKTVGLSETDVLGLANALASVGIEAEAGGSAVSNILIDMAKAAKTGSPDLERFATVTGLSIDEFSRLMDTDPAEAFNAFTQGLGRINAEGGDVFTTLKDLGQSDVRVTRALLGMANSGDLLTDSLKLGADAWRENTALVEEAAKRYDTTEARARVAWNGIKDNAIDAGQAMLPVVASVADGVSTLTDAFGALPSEVQGSLTVLAGVSGVTLLALGGIMKLTSSVLAAKESFAALELASPRAAAAIGRLSKAMSLGAIAYAAYATAGQIASDSSTASVGQFSKGLLDAVDSAEGSMGRLNGLFKADKTSTFFGTFALSGGIKDMTQAFNELDSSKFDRFADKLTPYEDDFDKASRAVGQMDAALTSWVSSGSAEKAAQALSLASEETGRSRTELMEYLPQYSAALEQMDTDQRLAGDGATVMADSMDAAAASLGMTREELEATQEAARSTGEGFITLGSSLNDSKVSLSDWVAEMEKQAQALEQFTQNAITAGKRGLDDGLIASLREAGPEGAMRLAQLADASESEIDRANQAWRDGQAAIDEYVNSVAGVPDSKGTTLEVTIRQAIDGVRAVQRAIDSMTGRTIGIRVAGPGGGGMTTAQANGGMWAGNIKVRAGGGFDEYGRPVARVSQMRSGGQGTVMWGEPETGWEAYISGKPGQETRNRDILTQAAAKLGGVVAFANGGMVDSADQLDTLRMQLRIRDLQRDLRETEKYGKGKKKRTRLRLRGLDRVEANLELREAREEYSATLRANRAQRTSGMSVDAFNDFQSKRESATDSFRGQASIDGLSTPAQVERSLERSISDMATLTSLLVALKKKGAAPWLLQQLQSAGPSKAAIRLARHYLADSAALAGVNAQARQLEQVSSIYGQVTSNPKWEAAGAWSGGLTSSESKTLNLTIDAISDSVLERKVTAIVVHNVLPMLQTGASV